MDDVTLTDRTGDFASLALEGPKAALIAQDLTGVDPADLAELETRPVSVLRIPCRLGKRSPGGAASAEFLVDRSHAEALWNILLEAVRKRHPACQVVVFGSSAEYGNSAAQTESIPETVALEPDSPYGVSKVAADSLAEVYSRAYGMNIIRIRPFFVIGPGWGSNVFVDVAKRIVEVENGRADSLAIGNVSAIRDLVDVRDAVRAIWTIAEKGNAGAVYNVCSGQARSIREALDIMLKFASKPVRVHTDKEILRPLDTARLVGDSSRLRQLGWAPEIPLEQTLADILQFWRTESQESLNWASAVQHQQ